MAVHLRTTAIADPMLKGIHQQKEAAFVEITKHLEEAQNTLIEVQSEFADFKSRVINAAEEYQQATNSPASLELLKGVRNSFLMEYEEFRSLYVKVSILAYKTLETINFLKPAYRIESEEQVFKKNLPVFFGEVQVSEKRCLEYVDKLQKMFTEIAYQKSVLSTLIGNPLLTSALDKLRILVETKDIAPSRASKVLSYISSYGFTPTIREPLPESIKPKNSPKRAALTPLNIGVIPPYNPQRSPLNRRVSISPSRPALLSSDSASPPRHRLRPPTLQASSSPRSSTVSSETSTSPRNLFLSHRVPSPRASRAAADSWESISLGASSSRRSSYSSRDSSPRPEIHTSSYSRRDRGVTSSRDLTPRRETYSRRDRGVATLHDSPSLRESYSRHVRRDREFQSPRLRSEISTHSTRTASREGLSHSGVYRIDRDALTRDQERRQRYSSKPSIQYKVDRKPHERR